MASTLPFGLQTTLPGTKFLPSKKKLVSFYLSNKIHGRQSETEAAFIPDRDLYGDREPWEIFQLDAGDPVSYDDDDDDGDDGDDGDDDGDDGVKGIYLFTRLKKISKNRIGRTVGKGTWHAEGRPKDYQVKVCGKFCDACHKRYLYRNEDSDHHKRWSLHEYSCPALSEDVVICILQKNEGKCPKRSASGRVDTEPIAPTLKRKSADVCPIATEEPKRVRFEAECIVESPTNANSEICPASSSGVEDCCRTFDDTSTFMVPRYSSTEGSGSNLSDYVDNSSRQEDNCYGMITDGGGTFTNLLLDQNNTENGGDRSSNTSSSEHAVESPANYNSEVSHCCASGVEEWSVGTAIVVPSYNSTEDAVGCGSSLPDWVDNYKRQQELEADNCCGISEGGGRFNDLLTLLLEQSDIENGDQDNLDDNEISSSPPIGFSDSYFDLWH